MATRRFSTCERVHRDCGQFSPGRRDHGSDGGVGLHAGKEEALAREVRAVRVRNGSLLPAWREVGDQVLSDRNSVHPMAPRKSNATIRIDTKR